MTEQELKDVLQGAIDGKEIQWNLGGSGEMIKAHWPDLSQLLADLSYYHKAHQFRVKPEVKVFKYKTRPYEIIYHTEKVVTNVWHSQMNTDTEQRFEDAFPVPSYYKSFKWLAPATEHEVEYE
jgi:hypothetical protein